MSMTDAGKNIALNAIPYDYASIHTGAPTAAGTANEVSGGTYARKAISMDAATVGAVNSSNQPVFNIPAATTITHYCLWAGGVCVDVGALSASETFTAAGDYTLVDADVTLNG